MPLHLHGTSGLHVVLPWVWECLRSGCSMKKSQQSKEAVGLFLRTRAGSPNCLTCCLGSPGCCWFPVAACAGTELRLQDLQRGSFSLSDISAGSWLSVDLCCSICLEHKSSESRTDPVLKWQNPLVLFYDGIALRLWVVSTGVMYGLFQSPASTPDSWVMGCCTA